VIEDSIASACPRDDDEAKVKLEVSIKSFKITSPIKLVEFQQTKTDDYDHEDMVTNQRNMNKLLPVESISLFHLAGSFVFYQKW
jgi:hypothetical protein